MIESNDLKEGDVILYENEPHMVLFVQHHKMAAADAVYRVKLKNLNTQAIFDRTFKAEEKFKEVKVEKRKKQFIYIEGNKYHFMDMDSYEDIGIDEDIIGDKKYFLTPNLEVDGVYIDGRLVDIELPKQVVLEVVEAPPSFKGDSVSNNRKPVKLETGVIVSAPVFIEAGDRILVDTRTKQYIERV